MLSMILYGRNDSYGYNLHKRAALSLNCMAELLGSDGDEILFVDYNTPDDYPTFPEAIRDTLTGRARRLLRIFRVRPALHRRFQGGTHLAVLEPVARNVALRRSNPGNRWVLSTNTDMIFVPRTGRSLGDVAATLDDALYHIPRFELPETLWEGLDRMDPAAAIAEIAQWGWALHLNEIVRGSDMILYDSPGDFQLATRADLFRIDGFDERMLLGWHVDSNLARRLSFLRRRPRSLAEHFFGYHCDHTRQATPMHRHDRVENDWRHWVDAVCEAEIPEQSERWGLVAETIEEIRLEGQHSSYANSLRAAIGEPMPEPTKIAYREESYDKVGYDPRHVVPFLIDAFSCYPRTTRIGWVGIDPGLLDLFTAAWEQIGCTGGVQVPTEATWLRNAPNHRCRPVPFTDLADAADGFVIDFGPRPASEEAGPAAAARKLAIRQVESWFRRLVMAERQRLEDKIEAPRRFIVVNAVHGRFESQVRARIGAAAAPIATRLRQGFVLPAEKQARSLLPVLETGPAGRRTGTSVVTLRGAGGHAFYGGYFDLMEGRYRLRLIFEPARLRAPLYKKDVMILEVVSGSHYLAIRPVQGAELAHGEVGLDFVVTEQILFHLRSSRIEVRLRTRGLVEVRITAVTLEELGAVPSASHMTAVDWLPLMFVGSAGELPHQSPRWWRPRRAPPKVSSPDTMLPAAATGVAARVGESGCVVFGPYVSLLPGRHLLEVDLAPRRDQNGRAAIDAAEAGLEVYCLVDDCVLAEMAICERVLPGARERLEFVVPDRLDSKGNPMQLEFRVWSSGKLGFTVRSVRTRPLSLLPIGAGEPEPELATMTGRSLHEEPAANSESAGMEPRPVRGNE